MKKAMGGKSYKGQLVGTATKSSGKRPASRGTGSSYATTNVSLDKFKQGLQKRNQAATRGKQQAKRAVAKKKGR